MYSMVDSCTCPDQGLNLQPWHIGVTLSPTELPGQAPTVVIVIPTGPVHKLCPQKVLGVCSDKERQIETKSVVGGMMEMVLGAQRA